MLVDRVHVVDLLHGVDVALREGRPTERSYPAFLYERSGHRVEDVPVLGYDSGQVVPATEPAR